MRVFLSYASEDRNQAEAIYLSLRGQGHTVFFDRTDLPPGEEYDARIRRAIERSQLLVFLVSPYSLDAGSYTLTELDIAHKTWEHPTGKVLPAVVRPTPLDLIPPYLKSVTLLETEGNLAATVADAVHRIALERRRAKLKAVAKGAAIRRHRLRRRVFLLGASSTVSGDHRQRWSPGGGRARRQLHHGRRRTVAASGDLSRCLLYRQVRGNGVALCSSF